MDKAKRMKRKFDRLKKSVSEKTTVQANAVTPPKTEREDPVRELNRLMDERTLALRRFIIGSPYLSRCHLKTTRIGRKGVVFQGNAKNLWASYTKDSIEVMNRKLKDLMVEDKKMVKMFPQVKK